MPARKSQPSPKPPRLNMMLIVADIHDRTGIPKEYISATLRGFKELVRDSMVAGVDIDMGADFGKFVAIEVAGREHYVPATGNTTRTPVRRRIRFRPSLKLRNLPPLGESAHLEGPATKAFGLSAHTSSTHPKEITSGDQAPADDPDAEVASVEAGIAEVIEDFLEEPEPGLNRLPSPKGPRRGRSRPRWWKRSWNRRQRRSPTLGPSAEGQGRRRWSSRFSRRRHRAGWDRNSGTTRPRHRKAIRPPSSIPCLRIRSLKPNQRIGEREPQPSGLLTT